MSMPFAAVQGAMAIEANSTLAHTLFCTHTNE